MILHDISRELLGCPVYPGDPAPRLEPLCRLEWGDPCNTSALSACLHNATHLDAPRHFVREGADAAALPLDLCVGECSVAAFEGILLGAQAEEMLPRLHKRVLFKGEMEISPSAAFVLGDAGLKLVGVEAQSVAGPEHTAAVHRQRKQVGTFPGAFQRQALGLLPVHQILRTENCELVAGKVQHHHVRPGRRMVQHLGVARPFRQSGDHDPPGLFQPASVPVSHGEALEVRLPLRPAVRPSRRRVIIQQAAGPIPGGSRVVPHRAAGKHGAGGVGEQDRVLPPPVEKVGADGMAPAHVPPHRIAGVELIIQMIAPAGIHQPVRVIHPAGRRGEMQKGPGAGGRRRRRRLAPQGVHPCGRGAFKRQDAPAVLRRRQAGVIPARPLLRPFRRKETGDFQLKHLFRPAEHGNAPRFRPRANGQPEIIAFHPPLPALVHQKSLPPCLCTGPGAACGPAPRRVLFCIQYTVLPLSVNIRKPGRYPRRRPFPCGGSAPSRGRRRALGAFYALTAPEMTPEIICFCRNRYRIITGSAVRQRAAMIAP